MNALVNNGFDAVIDTVRVVVQAQRLRILADSLPVDLWTFLMAVLYHFYLNHSVKQSQGQDPNGPYYFE